MGRKEVPRVELCVTETVKEVPVRLKREVGITEVQHAVVDCKVQVGRQVVEEVHKEVERVSTQVREVVEEVPLVLTEERVQFVPEIQTVEVCREEVVAKEVVVPVPVERFETQAIERVVQRP